jgi:hypothetical protein
MRTGFLSLSVCVTSVLAMSLFLVGCGSDSTATPTDKSNGPPSPRASEADQDDHAGHDHGDQAGHAHPTEGPHGGHLIELGCNRRSAPLESPICQQVTSFAWRPECPESAKHSSPRFAAFSGASIGLVSELTSVVRKDIERRIACMANSFLPNDLAQDVNPSYLTTSIRAEGQLHPIESTTQLAEPTGRAIARLVLRDGSAIEGQVLWADASLLKLHTGQSDTIVSKSQVQSIEALEGTERASRADVLTDRGTGRFPDLA